VVHVADLPPAPEQHRTVNFTIQIDTGKLVDASKEWAMQKLRAKAKAVGEIAVAKSKKRFDDGGDEGITWPDLWANDDARVNEAIARMAGGGESFGAYVAKELRLATANYDRTLNKINDGKLAGDKASKAKNRAAGRLERAKELQAPGNPSYRKGGKPLLDTGALRSSVTYVVSEDMYGVTVGIGPAVPYGRQQQEGFKRKGPVFIPLSIKAARLPEGADPDSYELIPGVDYVTVKGPVEIPSRPFVRFTDQNKKDIESAIAGRV